MLAVVLPDGSAGTIAAAATSVLGEEPRSGPEPGGSGPEPGSGPGTVLTVDGVRRLRALLGAKSRGPEDRGTRRRAA